MNWKWAFRLFRLLGPQTFRLWKSESLTGAGIFPIFFLGWGQGFRLWKSENQTGAVFFLRWSQPFFPLLIIFFGKKIPPSGKYFFPYSVFLPEFFFRQLREAPFSLLTTSSKFFFSLKGSTFFPTQYFFQNFFRQLREAPFSLLTISSRIFSTS